MSKNKESRRETLRHQRIWEEIGGVQCIMMCWRKWKILTRTKRDSWNIKLLKTMANYKIRQPQTLVIITNMSKANNIK